MRWAWCSALQACKDAPLRRELRFRGNVQGVGFRWRARQAAGELGLTGWVQNLEDGSVLMQVQGPEQDIDRLLLHLEASRYIRIENMSVKSLPLAAHEDGFSVRGY